MGERRKRKSMWDMEDETKTLPGMSEHNSSHDFSSSRISTGTKSRDRSGKPSQESNEEKISVGPLNASLDKSRQYSPEEKEIGGRGNRYYQNMSPGFEGIERHKYKHSIESDRSDFCRHPRRNRSRSRSRSRSNGSPRSRTRSRSPIGDYRHQSEKSSRICREFSAGRCARGSQCRFLHSKNNNRGHISKDSNFREDKSNSNAKYNGRVLKSGVVSIAESIGEKNMDSNIQQQDHGVAQSCALDEVNVLENPAHPIFFSGQEMDQNGHSSAIDGGLNVFQPGLANGFGSHLDGPEAQLEACLDLQSQTLRGQNDAQMTGLTPVTNPDVFPTPCIENAIKLPNITETEITILQSSPVRDSRCPISPSENERVPSEHGNHTQPDNAKVDAPENSKLKQEATALANSEAGEGYNNNKVARLFKNSLIEFVKDILKPTWKEGRLSRDVHKTIVKRVVDKVTSTVQDDQIPKTQEKVDQYLLFSKPKIAKLVQAYVERSLKTNS